MTMPDHTETYRGYLTLIDFSGEGDEILCLTPIQNDPEAWMNPTILAETLQTHMRQYSRVVSVRYFIAPHERTEDELAEVHFQTMMGLLDAAYDVSYSEFTGYLGTDESLVVGGHDLLAELKSYEGKFLHLAVTYHPAIRRVILWNNGLTMVFDSDGQQMPRYQDYAARVRDSICKDAPTDATFEHGVWKSETVQIDRSNFWRLAEQYQAPDTIDPGIRKVDFS